MPIGTCQRCGAQREYRYQSQVRPYCSHACSNAAKWDTRPRGKAVVMSCAHCSGSFSLLESALRSRQNSGGAVRFCSVACGAEARRKPGATVTAKCEQCGKSFSRRADQIERSKHSFCSRSCASAAQRTPGSKWSSVSPDRFAQREYLRQYLPANRERVNALSSAWAKANRPYRNFIQQVRRASGQITLEQWLEVFERCGGQCVACGAVDRLEVDHVVAVSAGGKTESQNLQILCRSCNASKGARPFDEWMREFRGIEVREVKA